MKYLLNEDNFMSFSNFKNDSLTIWYGANDYMIFLHFDGSIGVSCNLWYDKYPDNKGYIKLKYLDLHVY